MKQYRLVDDTGLFIEDCILDSVPVLTQIQTVEDDGGNTVTIAVPVLDVNGNTIPDPHYIETPCPGGFYHPKWDGIQWMEGGTQPEPQPSAPTVEERLNAAEAAIAALMGV
jgi:hypothetical protein